VNKPASSPISGVLTRWLIAISAFLLIGADSELAAEESNREEGGNAAPAWTETETRLANHYIRMLQEDPAFGSVLDLLWDLYEKKESTDLLIDYFRGAAKGGEVAVAPLLYAHLLRKAGETDEARIVYDSYLEENPRSAPALKALAEIADQQDREAMALRLYLRLVELVSPATEEGVAIRLRVAELHRQSDQVEEAVATWKELLGAHPADLALRSEIVAYLLETGATGEAVEVLEDLASSSDPRIKLEALRELNRLYEFVSDFEKSVDVARRGMALLHFKDHRHEDLFSRLVRSHERYERLGELEEELTAAASGENPPERALYLLAGFFRLTANPREEEEAVEKLVERVPGDIDYRVRLAEVRMRNDRYGEAAAVLDEVLDSEGGAPMRLVLLRAQVAVADENRVEAEEILTEFLERGNYAPDQIKDVIDFARRYYLDDLVESLLRRDVGDALAGGGGENAPIDLARFLSERGRGAQAIETLLHFVEKAGEAQRERARRLEVVARAMRDMGFDAEALDAIGEALDLDPGNASYLATRANILVDRREIGQAIETLEQAWDGEGDLEERTEIDQRIFSLLRGHFGGDRMSSDDSVLRNGAIRSLTEYRRLAAAASRARRAADEGPPKEVKEYFEKVKRAANETPSVATRYRAAWWAFKLQDNSECYFQLTAAQAEAKEPVVAVELMLLELAELNERPTLMARHLTTLAEIDPGNAIDYQRRHAEIRFALGFEDEAIRTVRGMAEQPDATLETLATLARLYRRQGNTGRQIEVWRRAFRQANVFEKRRVIKQLTNALVEAGRPEEALEAQLDLVERETDLVQRRKQLDTQVTLARTHFLLEWLAEKFEDRVRQNPFDRFYPEALARVLRATGDDRAAFEAMKKAYYMSGQDDSLLDELGRMAGQLDDLQSAIYYRRQIIAREGGEASIESWKSLIDMLERDFRANEADRLRRRLETRFGQDPDFLREMARFYRGAGRLRSAERVLMRLTKLRDWDVRAHLELGLLKRETGREAEALAHFEAVIEQTVDEEPGAGETPAWPIVRVGAPLSRENTTPAREVDRLAAAVESFPFLGGSLQDEVVDWLRRPRPEFHYLPRGKYAIRLRAIEEAASWHADNGSLSAFLERFGWADGSRRPMVERLWAARYGRDRTSFIALLESQSFPEDEAGRFWLVYSHILAGARDLSFLGDFESRIDGPGCALLAAFVQLREMPRDPLLDRSSLVELLAVISGHENEKAHLFTELRKHGQLDDAFLVGQVLATTEFADEGNFLFAVSQVADWTGRPKEHREWLERSLVPLAMRPGSRISSHFLPALSERLALSSGYEEREDVLARARRRIARSSQLDRSDRIEKELLVSIAAGRYGEAVEQLGTLAVRQTAALRPSHRERDEVRYSQSQGWTMMGRLVGYYHDRIPAERGDFDPLEAMSRGVRAFPSDETVIAAYEIFEIERVVRGLDGLGAHERHGRVQELYSRLQDPDSPLELGRVLEQRGYHREAIPVYRAEALRHPGDYSPLREFFNACHEAFAPEPALEVVAALNAGEWPTPPGLTVDYINEQHARFLFHRRDRDRLTRLARVPTAGRGAPPISTDAHLPFQRALIELYRFQGEETSLVRLLELLREGGELGKRDRLLGVRTLMRLDRLEEADTWLEEFPLDGAEPALEEDAARLRLELDTLRDQASRDRLTAVARYIMDGGSPLSASEVAEFLVEAGYRPEAASLLAVAIRSATHRGERNRLAIQRLAILIEEGAGEDEVKEEFERCLATLPEEGGIPSALIALVTDTRRDLYDEVFADAIVVTPAQWLVDLSRAHRDGILEREARRVWSDLRPGDTERRDDFLEALAGFGDTGIRAARQLVDENGLPGDRFFLTQPARQVRFFSAIGDRDRLAEVHARLMRESESDIFPQRGLERYYPTLHHRQRVPAVFAEAGHLEMAAALFEAYEGRIRSYTWDHQVFLSDHLRFLIDSGDFERAESLFVRITSKNVRVDLRLLADLYREWGKLDAWESRTRDWHLTEGRRALLRDWRSALAEGREMVEYRNTW